MWACLAIGTRDSVGFLTLLKYLTLCHVLMLSQQLHASAKGVTSSWGVTKFNQPENSNSFVQHDYLQQCDRCLSGSENTMKLMGDASLTSQPVIVFVY